MYADDTQMYLSFDPSDTQAAVSNLNEDLRHISQWSEANTLVLNPGKTKYMIMGSKAQVERIKAHNPVIDILGERVERVAEARNLGVLIDEALNFENHVLEIVRNSFYRLKILYRVRDFLSEDLRIKLCDSLVLSRLGYADTVYGPRLRARTDGMVQRVQNACARFCFKIPPRTHVTPYLNKSNLLKMTLRRELHLATLLFGIQKHKEPEYLFKKLKWRSEYSSRPVRTATGVLVPYKHRTTAFRGSFRYTATKCWNNIPPPLRDLQTVHNFKFKFKQYLFDYQKQLPVGFRVFPTYS